MKKFSILLAILAGLVGGARVASAQTAASLTLSPSSITMYAGQTQIISVSGGTSYYLGSNINPSVASAVLSGNSITINALSVGTDSVSVCTYSNGGAACAGVNVTVQKNPNVTPTSQAATISFSQNQVTVNVGASVTVTASGSGAGSFYVSNVSTDAVSASVPAGSNAVTIQGSNVGGANVTVCQFGGTCGNIYAYVPPTAVNTQAIQTSRATNPQLSAFYVASNNVGGGMFGTGATLTFKFNTSDDITSKIFRVGGKEVQANGTSSGTYSASYVMTGSESMPLPVSIDFWAADGTSGHAYFTLGDGVRTPVQAAAATGAAKFTRGLSSGSSGSEVTALQSLLKKIGLYDGPVTGNFGPLTEAAVKRYQGARGIDQLGIVGPSTRAALNKEQ